MSGPCATNIQAAFILGYILLSLSFLCILGQVAIFEVQNLIIGIAGTLINGILVYGACKRSSKAILFWMILAIIECIGIAVVAVMCIMVSTYSLILLKLQTKYSASC